MITLGKKARRSYGGKVSRYTVRRMKKENKSGKEFNNSFMLPDKYRQMKDARRRATG